MPIEFTVLKDQPSPIEKCPRCGVEPFEPFLRGQIQRGKWDLLRLRIRPYCTLICTACKEIVGHEHPVTGETTISRPHLLSKLGGILRGILRCS
jgi:hypothetical protein